MCRISCSLIASAAMACGVLAAADPPQAPPGQESQRAPAKIDPADRVGKPAPALALSDLDGKAHDLATLRDRIVVIEWTSPHCAATVRAHNSGVVDRLIKNLRREVADIVYLQVCSTRGATPMQLEALRRQTKANIPILMDADGSAAKAWGAMTTPHMFVIDAEGVLRYHGAIDNDPSGQQQQRARPVLTYPLQAVQQIVAEKDVRVRYERPYGSPIRL